ncbi:MAG: hypothetical protein N4A55_07370 [Vallitalea sp.]|jgi:hypothetical protein|nr:hypothetical protein [Vallitalea sp.]MCT4687103.1 hypothetical protein [Vallitalea sp.]
MYAVLLYANIFKDYMKKDIKGNDKFRRFNYRTLEKVYKEFMLYTMARNLNKYHRFIMGKIQKFEGKTVA